MPGYVKNHSTVSITQQHSPYQWEEPMYGATVQYSKGEKNLPRLPPPDLTCIQQVVGMFLYYAHAIYDTMLVTLKSIASDQAIATSGKAKDVAQLLDYAATHPDVTVRFHASRTCLHININAFYLSI